MRYFLFTLLTVVSIPVQSQTILKGTVLSINGEPVPKTVITIDKQNQADLFSDKITEASGNGNFRVTFDTPGIYSVQIRSVFHETVSFPLLIYDQEIIETKIFVQPQKYNDGKYFKNPEYLEWIRVYGNFNQYDYFEGIPFKLNDDGSVSAVISTESDTIRYQIRGLTSGISVLPGADSYNQRPDGSFEAVIARPAGEDNVELRYDPSEKLPYPRKITTSDSNTNTFRPSKRAYLYFSNPDDFYCIDPLFYIKNSYSTISAIDTPEPDFQNFSAEDTAGHESYLEQIHRGKKRVEHMLETRTDLHEQQLSAYYIAYASLLARENVYWDNITQHPEKADDAPVYDVDTGLVKEIVQKIPPTHPLWEVRPSPALVVAELLECVPDVIRYIELMAEHHLSEDVFRDTVIFLLRNSADKYSEVEEVPYYQWVLERYGNRNLARLMRKEFQEVYAKQPEQKVCHQYSHR